MALLRRHDAWPAAALIVLCAYAAFARGAVGLPQETWLQAGVAVLVAVLAGAWLGARAVRPAADPLAVGGVVLLVAFAAWTGLSLVWSVAPEATWEACNRAATYALVAGVALVVGSVVPRAVERIAVGWLVVATGVALYALAGKVLPGVVHHANDVARLRAPLEYWNALGLVCVLGAAPAIRIATLAGVRARWRVASLVALFVLLSVLGMTYSRGGLIALAVVVIVLTVTGERRFEGLIAFALAAVAAAPVLALAYTVEGLSDSGAAHDDRVRAGLLLLGVMVGVGAVLALVGRWCIRREERVVFGRRSWLGLLGVVVALAAGSLAALAVSDRGLGGSVDHAVDSFTEVRRDRIFEPGRLLSTSSGNRWAWWREAAGAFADEPLRGWGGGSFPVARRLYRVSPYDVQQPHSLPMQVLAETGLVGALLLLAALGLLFVAGVKRVRRRDAPGEEDLASVIAETGDAVSPEGGDRDLFGASRMGGDQHLFGKSRMSGDRHLAGALLAAAAAWAVHACIDWDWDIPGVTVPVVVFLGVLGGRRAAPRPATGIEEEGRALEIGALAATALVLLAFVTSAALPAWSDAKTDDALQASEQRSEERLRDAAADADLAARLDPVAVRPLFAGAAIAEGRGRLLEARDDLLEAVDRQPWSLEAWRRLIGVAVRLADRDGVRVASRRALELDPANTDLVVFVRRAQGVLAPAEASATATGTPLTP